MERRKPKTRATTQRMAIVTVESEISANIGATRQRVGVLTEESEISVVVVDHTNKKEMFEMVKTLLAKGQDRDTIKEKLGISDNRARMLIAQATAAMTLDDYNLPADARRALVRAGLNKIAMMNDNPENPEQAKIAVMAYREIAKDSEIGILRKDVAVTVDFSKVGMIASVSMDSVIDVSREEE